MTEEELRGRRGEWSESVCSLYHPFGQTAKSREGREENWLLSLDWEEVHACIHTRSLCSAPTRLTDSDRRHASTEWRRREKGATTMHELVISPDPIEEV